MTKVTETDLLELKDLILSSQRKIEQSFQAIGQQIETLQKDVTDLKVGQAKLEKETESIGKQLASLEGRTEAWKPSIDKIPDLAEKVGELKNWRQTAFLIITAFVSGIFSGTIGWILRGARIAP
jgi:chromosome segregation ATPase